LITDAAAREAFRERALEWYRRSGP
jgi:hypothetical protein